VRERAHAAYRLFLVEPGHASLAFKRLRAAGHVHAARIGLHDRAVGVRDGDEIVWF